MSNKLLTRQQAAEQLTVSLRTLDGLIQRGALPAYRVGPKIVRIKEQDLEDYLNGRLVTPQTKQPAQAAPVQRICRYVPGMKVV